MDADQYRAQFERALDAHMSKRGSYFLYRLFGFKSRHEGEECVIAFDATPMTHNGIGSVHGGVLATAIDSAMAHLVFKQLGPCVTLELKTQYLTAVSEGRIECRARFLKKTRSIVFLEARATNAAGELLAHATGTFKLTKPKE